MKLTLHLYELNDASWDTLPPVEIIRLGEVFQKLPLQDAAPDRFGFVRSQPTLDWVVGYFAHEYLHLKTDYDPDKTEIVTPVQDFEHYLFILLPNQKQVLFQHRRSRFPNYPALSTIIHKFSRLLSIALRDADLHISPDLTPAELGYTREEFISIFADPDYRVMSFDLVGLDPSLLPEDFKFFNPNADWDEVYQRGNRISTSNVHRVAMNAKPNGDLKQSPDARGYVNSSVHPRSMKVVHRRTQIVDVLEARQEVTEQTEISGDYATTDEVVQVVNALRQRGPTRRTRSIRRDDPGQMSLF